MLAGRLRRRKRDREHLRSQALLPAYLDDALPGRERAVIEAHARTCERCRSVILSPPSAMRMLRSLKTEAPPRLVEGILARLAIEATSEQSTPDRAPAPALREVAGRGIAEANRSRGVGRARLALACCLRPGHLRRALPITLLAGLVLTAMYQLRDLLDGRAHTDTYIMCACNFVVAFVLVSLGPLIASSAAHRRTSSRRRPT